MDYRKKEAINQHFGEIIRKYREGRHWSQDELAVKCGNDGTGDVGHRNRDGISRDYIGRIERGEVNITLSKCSKLADGFGVRLYDLFKDLPE